MKWLNCNILLKDSNGMYAGSITGDFLLVTQAISASLKTKDITLDNLEKLLNGSLIFINPQLCDGNSVLKTFTNETAFSIDISKLLKITFKALFKEYSDFLNSFMPTYHSDLSLLLSGIYNIKEKIGDFEYET